MGEIGYRGGELPALADVASDGDRVAGSGMGTSQCFAACGRELGEPWRDQVDSRDDLHVAELAHVVVLAVQRAPSDEDVGGTLDKPLAFDNPFAMILEAAR